MEIIPLLCFLLMIGLFTGPWRERFLLASVGWGVLVLIITEVLSIWQGLDRFGLAITWGAIVVLLAARYWFVKPELPLGPFDLNIKNIVIVSMVSGILLVTALIAFCAAPNNWDSMTYHLARVAHWAQNRTVALFPTHVLRQICYPPGSSYVVTQFYILAGSDRWVNFVQWFSSLGSMIGASLIVARLKGKGAAQALAALIVATTPMGILQSTSTQNDYVVSFWLVCFVYFGLALLQEGRWLYSVTAGASLGLAWLVKGTAYVYCVPFLIWIIVGGIKAHGRKFLIHTGAILIIAVLINSPYFLRNYSLSGSMAPSSGSIFVMNKKPDLKVLTANFTLNLGLQLATVWDKPNQLVTEAVDRVLQWSGIEKGDPRLYLDATTFDLPSSSFRRHEDYAGNPPHTILIFICLLAGLFGGQAISKDCRTYGVAMVGTILLFVIFIKWSAFHGRYHLPVFILFAPFLAVVLSNCFPPRVSMAVAVILMIASVPWVIDNRTRPLLGKRNVMTTPRIEQYFFNRQPEASYVYPLLIAAQVNCKQIGIVLGGEAWEYPVMAISQWQHRKDIRFEDVLVNNVSAHLKYPLGDFDPCIIIENEKEDAGVLNWNGHAFAKIDQRGEIRTYLRVN